MLSLLSASLRVIGSHPSAIVAICAVPLLLKVIAGVALDCFWSRWAGMLAPIWAHIIVDACVLAPMAAGLIRLVLVPRSRIDDRQLAYSGVTAAVAVCLSLMWLLELFSNHHLQEQTVRFLIARTDPDFSRRVDPSEYEAPMIVFATWVYWITTICLRGLWAMLFGVAMVALVRHADAGIFTAARATTSALRAGPADWFVLMLVTNAIAEGLRTGIDALLAALHVQANYPELRMDWREMVLPIAHYEFIGNVFVITFGWTLLVTALAFRIAERTTGGTEATR